MDTGDDRRSYIAVVATAFHHAHQHRIAGCIDRQRLCGATPRNDLTRTYNPLTQNYTSTMDAGGRTRWTYYDRFGRPGIQVGPNGSPKEVALRFLSRQGSSSDAFQPSSPNAELTLHPADGGAMETFIDGSAWEASSPWFSMSRADRDA